MKDVIGFYRNRETADQVKSALIEGGYSSSNITVYDGAGKAETGIWEDIKSAFGFTDDAEQELYTEATRRGGVAVALNVEDEDSATAQKAVSIMQRFQPMDLDAHASQWAASGWQAKSATSTKTAATAGTASTATAATASTATGTPRATGQAFASEATRTSDKTVSGKAGDVLPVIEEQLQIGKRQVESGGVRIHSRVTEKPVEAQVQLRTEHVNVERRPTDRPVTDADQAFRERSFEVRESSEEAVVAKQARVVEEVVVNKDVQQKTQTVRDTVRRTDVDVEQVPAGATTDRTQFVSTFTDELARDEKYRGSDWKTVEPEARRSFEQRYPGSTWEQVKDTIRSGWDRARQKV